jgi:hypothetical protein
MKRVLIVSPHWPPVNAPDMQRARLALNYLRDLGWEPVVLAVEPAMVEGAVLDPLLEASYPADIRVVRVRGIPARLTRWAGVGALWWRCGRAVRRAGEALLGEGGFDLVFFSTTQFDAFALGPRWLKRFGVPYVLDYQDPWINDYYHRTGTPPPGGWVKFNLSQWLARRREPAAVRGAAAIVTVSDAYGKNLARSYPWFEPRRVRLLPFGAAESDFQVAARHRPARPLVDFTDGNFHHVYVGRCGPDMSFAMSVIFRAFKLYQQSHPAEAARILFHFIGTDYAPPPLGREWAMPVARAEGVENHVREHCYRVPYFDALYYLQKADALLAVGSNDPSYSASKIFPYILARRPILVVFHEQSPVLAFARQARVGVRLSFAGPEDINVLAADVHLHWFVEGGRSRFEPFDAAAFAPFTAASLTARLAAVFNTAAGARTDGIP